MIAMHRQAVAVLLLALAMVPASAVADVSISNKPTANMDCQSGVCTATATKAVLNVGDLQTMLSTGDVAVKTGSLAKDIDIDQPLTWSTTSRLTLDAQQSVAVKKLVTVGQGALTLTTNDGGSGGDLYFFGKGCVAFGNLSSSLIINGQSYTLAGDLPTLAEEMNNSNGSFALANDYDAKADRFKHSPVGYFEGNFEGLGHTVGHLKIRGGDYQRAGMFAQIGGGTVRDIYLTHLSVLSKIKLYVGGLAGENDGTIINASVDGRVGGGNQFATVGGLVGRHGGLIERSRSAASVSGTGNSGGAGGLVGHNDGIIDQSYATGSVTGAGIAGGLVGDSDFTLVNSYATGSVSGDDAAGGFAGAVGANVNAAYSLGAVTGACVGGFVGSDGSGDALTHSYWDLDTSGVTDPSQGACDIRDAGGIIGLTDSQIKSGLPNGFDPTIWDSDPKINNGYPYLLANPPQ